MGYRRNILICIEIEFGTSGQDGGIGKHASPPCTITEKSTTPEKITKPPNKYHPEQTEN